MSGETGGDEVVLRLEKNKLPRVTVVSNTRRVQHILGYQPENSEIHVIEALYILYTGQGRAVSEDGAEIGFKEVMEAYTSINPLAWVEFEVYYDLKKRGRMPVPGPRPHTLLLRGGKKSPKYTRYILVLEESRSITPDYLSGFVEEALHNDWEPVVAIVDRYGDITYYSITLFRPQRLIQASQQ